ncbi:MAG: YraN family protein [Actinomycetales bacterium]|nr:YraN family protein [Actinomycetales bacterium]
MVDGAEVVVTARDVEHRLHGVIAEPRQRWGVRVNGTVFPVKQAFEVVTGLPRSRFTSQTASRNLGRLGFELVGQVEPRESPPRVKDVTTADSGGDDVWCREANVQAAVVDHLRARGWRVLSTADTERRERGIDVLATREAVMVAIEVKGYPERRYADPARSHETKPTHPSNQARHWYAQAVLTAMVTRSERPDDQAVIALPDVRRYRDLYRRTRSSLDTCGISLWWVTRDGTVTE